MPNNPTSYRVCKICNNSYQWAFPKPDICDDCVRQLTTGIKPRPVQPPKRYWICTSCRELTTTTTQAAWDFPNCIQCSHSAFAAIGIRTPMCELSEHDYNLELQKKIQHATTKTCPVCMTNPIHISKSMCNGCKIKQIQANQQAAAQAKQRAYNQYVFRSTPPFKTTKGTPVSPTKNIKCTIKWTPDVDAYVVSTPYSAAFVEFLKAAIPVSDRYFDRENTKTWWIKEKYFDAISSVASKVWSTNEIVIETRKDVESKQQARTAPAVVSKASIEDVLANFVRLLPKDVVKQAYRRGALELHPDRNGGDGSKMASLNALWTRIEKELFASQ